MYNFFKVSLGLAVFNINRWLCVCVLTSLFGVSTCSHRPVHLYSTSHVCRGTLLSSCKIQHSCITVYLNGVWLHYLISTGFWSESAECVIVYYCKITEGYPPAPPSKVCPLLPTKDHNYYVKKTNSAAAYWHCSANVSLVITEANITLPHTITIPYLWLKPALWSILMKSGGLRSLKANWGCAGVLLFSFFGPDDVVSATNILMHSVFGARAYFQEALHGTVRL